MGVEPGCGAMLPNGPGRALAMHCTEFLERPAQTRRNPRPVLIHLRFSLRPLSLTLLFLNNTEPMDLSIFKFDVHSSDGLFFDSMPFLLSPLDHRVIQPVEQ
jgi:hypothetical protein